ncbi:MAG TPA: ABC transporter permease [Ktedonobacteraceae bacterium]|jgi:peptide/nickel transport system permease protein|nr:ABC transporter permease [Ktedonobacteraceae bacterium]
MRQDVQFSLPDDASEASGSIDAVQQAIQHAPQRAQVLLAGEIVPAAESQAQDLQWRRFSSVFLSNPRVLTGLYIVGFFILIGLFGPFLTHQDPNALSSDMFRAPSPAHWLGTTQRGEDIFSQIAYGARVSLLMSFAAAIGATLIAVVAGLAAGYFGGWIDEVISFLINIFLVLPGMPLAIVIASFAVKGPVTIVLVLLFTSWPWGARVLRAQTLSIRQREFVTSARVIGERPWQVILVEILPNEIALVASSFVSTFVHATLTAVALEFLGLGDMMVASWGTVLHWAQVDSALMANGWWQFVPAGLCVAILCAGLTFINFGIDEIANPALRSERKLRKSKKGIA